MRCFYLLILAALCSSCYSAKQAYHFTSLYFSKVPVSEAIENPEIPEKFRNRLGKLDEILAFARSEKLNVEGAYVDYIHSSSGAVTHLVQAAKKDKLEFKEWWFPIVGTVPYLGFFEKKDRDEEYERLAEEYDVSRGAVGAFSLLGWLEDPIFTSMLRSRYSGMAHLFFHELIHRTFWSAGSVRFNENLAEFAAEIITKRFLISKGMEKELEEYLALKRDKLKFKVWLKDLRGDLDKLYSTEGLAKDLLFQQKREIFERYKTEKVPQFETSRYGFVAKREWNNASVMGASLYAPNYDRFLKAFKCLNSPKLGVFMNALEEAEDEYDDNFKALDSLCK